VKERVRSGKAVQVLSADVYDAFGNKVAGNPNNAPYGYKAQWGYRTDHETGLLLLTHRYYDPINARFLTRDPIGYEGGINLYGYTNNQPIGRKDPLGLVPVRLSWPCGAKIWMRCVRDCLKIKLGVPIKCIVTMEVIKGEAVPWYHCTCSGMDWPCPLGPPPGEGMTWM
jgi:RHS repeat-associated protein